jgi:hypothetical protein
MEWSTWLVAVLLLRHGVCVPNEFSENSDRWFAGSIDPIDPYAVVGVGVFRDLESLGCAVVKFHGQGIRREDIVCGLTTPLSGDVLISRGVGDPRRTSRKQNCNRRKPSFSHDTLDLGRESMPSRSP